MKTKSNLWTWLAIVIVIIVSINFFILRKPKSVLPPNYQAQIDSLNKVNDSLLTTISDNQKLISEKDSINRQLEHQISDTKFKLGELNSKATIYKQLYNEEHNRIDNLTNPQLSREFTNAFD